MLRAMLDPFARKLGYTPISHNKCSPIEKTRVQNSGSEDSTMLGCSHLSQEAAFDYEKSEQNNFYFYYFGEVNGFAVGKRDWIPLTTLIGLLSGRGWLLQSLVEGTWIKKESPLWKDWLDANFEVLNTLQRKLCDYDRIEASDENYANIEDANVESKVTINLRYERLAMEYLRIMAVAHPLNISTSFSLADPSEVIRYRQTKTNQNLYGAIGEARESANMMAVAWFQNRGFEIDQGSLLIKLPGYQPLFYVGAQDL